MSTAFLFPRPPSSSKITAFIRMNASTTLRRIINGTQLLSSHCRNIEVLTYPKIIVMEIPLYSQSDSMGRMIEILREPYGMTIVFEQKERELVLKDLETATRFK